MSNSTINIAQEFSEYPGPRYKSLGPNSGELFRDTMLKPAMDKFDKITIVLDGTMGYGSSFLEEAFGGLVRSGYSARSVLDKLSFVSEEEPELIEEIVNYIKRA